MCRLNSKPNTNTKIVINRFHMEKQKQSSKIRVEVKYKKKKNVHNKQGNRSPIVRNLKNILQLFYPHLILLQTFSMENNIQKRLFILIVHLFIYFSNYVNTKIITID